MLKKRAQGLSVTTIIVAVIALIVLVIMIAIFTGKVKIFSTGVESAASCDNLCKAFGKEGSSSSICSNGQKISGEYKDAPLGCCCKEQSTGGLEIDPLGIDSEQ